MDLATLIGQSFETNLIGLEVEIGATTTKEYAGKSGIVVGCFMGSLAKPPKEALVVQLIIALHESGKLVYLKTKAVTLTPLSLKVLQVECVRRGATVVTSEDQP